MKLATALRGAVSLALSLAVLLSLGLPPAVAAAKRPNLVVGKVTPSVTTAVAGTRLSVTIVVANSGKAQAKASSTALVLSADRTMSAGDRKLATLSAPKLKPGKKKATTTKVALPATAGRYYLIACADAPKKVRESNEGDNCRAVAIVVTPRPAPTPPTTPPTPPSNTRPKVVSVSASPNPVHVEDRSSDPVSVAYEVVVRNDNATATAATSVRVGIPADGATGLGASTDLAVKTIGVPALAPGASVTVTGSTDFGMCEYGCVEGAQDFHVVACVDAGGTLSGCASAPFSIIVDPCDCWPDEVNLTTSVSFSATGPVTLGSAGVVLSVTVHVVNEGDAATSALPAVIRGFVGDWNSDFGWVEPHGVTQPDDLSIVIPPLNPGEDVDIQRSIHFPAYVNALRASTRVFAFLRSPGVSDPLASADLPARLEPTYDGTNLPDFIVQPGSVTAERFFAGAGKSDSRSVTFTWGNTGTDPGDVVGVAAQINDAPEWDPAAPMQGYTIAYEGLSGSRTDSIGLTWTGPVPSGTAYIVVCADTVTSDYANDWPYEEYWPHIEADETNNCVSTPATFVDLDSAPSPVPGYDGPLPAADPLDVTVAPAGAGILPAPTFGWQRLLPYNQIDYRDQVWSLNPVSGVHATVTLPWKTFIENVVFTVKPVTVSEADDPLPFDDVIAALELAPGDLLTNTPYTVDFALDPDALTDVDQNELVAFAADSDGSNLRLVPLTRNANGTWAADRLRVSLSHFGVVGLATIGSTARAELASRVPTDNDRQIEAVGAEPTLALRLAALGVPRPLQAGPARLVTGQADGDWYDEWVTHMVQRYNNVVIPAYEAAYTGGELDIEVSLQITLEWQRAVALLGGDEHYVLGPLTEEASRRVTDLLYRAADLVKQQCVSGGGFAAFRKMLKQMRTLQLWGLDSKANELAQALGACSSFQVSYRQAWTDTNTNAHLSGEMKSNITLNAPTLSAMRTGSVPHGNATLDWTNYLATTTDTFDMYDGDGNLTGHCEVTTTSTPKSGSYMTFYVKDYGLSFMRNGKKRQLSIGMWLFGSSTDASIGSNVPMMIHRSRVNGCPAGHGIPSAEWDVGDLPYPDRDPAIQNVNGFRNLSLDWVGGHYEHTWSVVRGGDEHPRTEQLEIRVDPNPF